MTKRKFALLYIPYSGLHYAGAGEFLDGKGNLISWKRRIEVYNSHARAVLAKERILAKYGAEYAQGQIVVMNVDIVDKEFDDEHS